MNQEDRILLSHSVTDTVDGELLSLAARQRMNTDVRKAVFCTLMGSQDVLDACEKLLRLPLKVSFIFSRAECSRWCG